MQHDVSLHLLTPVHLDFETASPTDLKKCGAHVYCEDTRTRIWGFSYSWGDGLVYQWRWGDAPPLKLLWHIGNGGEVVAHNASFERNVWNRVLRRYFPEWPEMTIRQQNCTLARAAVMSLPTGLDQLGAVFDLKEAKDKEGFALMKKMAKPRKVHGDGKIIWWDEPGNIDRLMQYCDQDVRTELEADKNLPQLSPHEQALWQLDQTINDRGLAIDLDCAARATELVDYAQRVASEKIAQLTSGVVKKISDRTGMLAWLNARGIAVDKLNKGNTDEVLAIADFADDALAREVIELRNAAGKTSVAKYAKMMECVCEDARIRGTLQYHGATTGRWAGRLIQPQNFPRTDPERDEFGITYVVTLLQSRTIPVEDVFFMIETVLGEPMPWLSKALRAMIVAAPGKVLYGGDFSNVEGRGNAWLAGEEWKLEAFRAFDAGTGPDLYKVAYARAFGVMIETVTKAQRQIGKVMELALGYQGGVGAFLNMGAVYGLKTLDLVGPIKEAASAEEWDAMSIRYDKARDKFGMTRDEWVAVKIIIKRWRVAHPNIVQGWWDLSDAAIAAVDLPGQIFYAYHNRVSYVMEGTFLYCRLPSGRVLSYACPFVKEKIITLVDKNGDEYDKVTRSVHYFAMDQGRWTECYMYGGLQCENVVSGTCRCLLDRAMTRVEQAGYPLVVTVHDEIVSETPEDFGTVEEFTALMSQGEEWAPGFPIAAAAWRDPRYVK